MNRDELINMETTFYTSVEAGIVLRTTRSSILRACNLGLLDLIKDGKFLRITKDSVLKYMDVMENSYSGTECAELLGVSQAQASKMIQSGVLESFMFGKRLRVTKSCVDKLVEENAETCTVSDVVKILRVSHPTAQKIIQKKIPGSYKSRGKWRVKKTSLWEYINEIKQKY